MRENVNSRNLETPWRAPEPPVPQLLAQVDEVEHNGHLPEEANRGAQRGLGAKAIEADGGGYSDLSGSRCSSGSCPFVTAQEGQR